MQFRKILSLLVAVTMLFSCVGITAMAEETATVVKIGDTPYGTLADALTEASAMTGDVTVEIYDKVTLNQNLAGSYNSITFVGKADAAEIYLEVQGYITATGKSVAFENLKLSKSEGVFITNAGFMNVAFGVYDVKSVTYTDCTFANGAYASSGDVTYTGCTFYRSHDKYGLWAYGDVEAVVDNCTFADYRGIKMYAEGAAKTVNLTVKNTDFTAVDNKPAIVLTYGESVTLEGNTYSSTGMFELDLGGDPNGTPVTSDVPVTCKNDNGACGVLVDGKIYTTVAQAAEVAEEGSTVVLLHDSTETVEFAEGVTLDKNGFTAENVTVAKAGLSGSGTQEDPYKIGTSEELFLFASKVNDGTYKGVYAELTADIDLEQEDWTSIGTSSNPFTGTFDGKNFTISNVWSYERGLFGFTGYGNYVDGPKEGRATIKNLTINGVEVYNQTTSAVGGVVGQAGQNTEISGVTVTGYVQVWGYGYVGGIVGQGYVHIDDCHVIGVNDEAGDISGINAAYWAVGGVVGHAGSEGGASITNCSVENVKIYSSIYGAGSIAGVGTSGKIENVSAKDVIVEAQSSPDANGYLVGCNYDKIIGNSTATNVTLIVNDVEHPGTDMVAKVGNIAYVSLESAFAAAAEGDTITLLADATPVLTSQRAITKASVIDLNGKTLTLTEDDLYFGTTTFKNGNIIVDPSVKPSTAVFWMFKNQTLTFDAVKITATGVTGTYLIGLDGDNSDLNLINGSEIIVNNAAPLDLDIICVNASTGNDILIENSKVNVTNLDGRVFFRGNYTVSGDSVIYLDGITKAGFRIEVGQTLDIKDTANVTVTGEPRDGGIHITDATATYTKADTATVNATVNAPVTFVAVVNGVGYETLQAAAEAAKAGDTITMLADTTVTEEITFPAGITFNGNGKSITGNIVAGGNLTFEGHTKVSNFNAGYDKPTITIGEGACLELTGSGRMVIGHGATFNITGSITDAKNANVADLAPSLIVAAGASFTGTNLTFNVTNAYIKFNSNSTSKNKNANGTFNFNITNSIWEQTGVLGFYVPTEGMDPTFNLALKDSVLTTTSHLVFGVSKGEIVIDNSNVNVGTSKQIENRSKMTIKNGSVVNGAVATSSNAINPGTLIVENATYAVSGQFSGSGVGTGTLIIKKGANVSVGSIVDNANIVIDATGMKAGDEINLNAKLDKFSGTLSVINNSLEAKIVDGKIVLVAKPVAKIGETTYVTLEEAFKAANDGCTIDILNDVVIDYKWDCRDYATNGSHSQFKETVTINGNNHTIKFTGTISDGNWNTIFRFEENAIVKNLTVDISEATGAQRVITAKKSLNVDNLTIKGSARYGIIFGEGATVADLANAEISIANSNLYGTRRAISDNEGGKDVKSVTITGNELKASVYVSALETVTFTGNTVTDGYVDIRSYTANNTLDVTATGNTLKENTDTNYNYIKAGGTVNAQEGFLLPWDGVTISNLDELKMFRDAVNAGNNYAGKTVTLTADIDLAGENWTPIGTIYNEHGFMGNFDGQNHKIMNLTITEPALDSDGYAYAGLFGITEGTDKDNQNFVKDLTIENVTINTTGHIVAAAIAYPYYTIVDNVKVCGKISISGGDYTAGVLAYTRRCINASNLSVVGDTGSTISGKQVVGGVISDIQMNGGLTADYSNFNVSGVVISGTKNVGGISGIICEQKLIGGSVKDVTLSCDDARVGIVSGSLGGDSVISNVTIDNVTGASSIVGADYATGKVVEAKIGDKYYKTLADALKANVESEITLLAPIVIEAGETLTLNKNVTITYTSNVPGEDMITNRGNLVIDGATLVYTNTDTTANNVTVSTISCEPGSTLEVKSGTVQNDSANKGAAGIYAYAIDLVTNGNLGDVKATISGGNVISTNYMAIRQFNNGDACKNILDVTDGYIYGAQRAIQVHLKNDAAYTTISGGKIEGGGYALCFYPENATHLTVDGGEFKGSIYSGTNCFISGGTFDAEPYAGYAAEGHVFEKNADGTWSVVEIEEVELFDFYTTTVTLDNSLAINFYVEDKNLTGDSYYAEIEHKLADGSTNKVTIPYAQWGTKTTGYHSITYKGLVAKHMSDEIRVTIYDSNSQVSETRVDGLRAYALRGLEKFTDTKLLTALVDMLNYGAAAQLQFNYNTENLANAGLTDEQKAYASTSVSVENIQIKGDNYLTTTLSLENNIQLTGYFTFADGVDGKYAEVKFTDSYNNTHAYTVTSDKFVKNTDKIYGVCIEDLAIADAKCPVTITLYNADGSEYGSLVDSMSSYLYRIMQTSDAEIFKMIARFTTSAYNALH